MDRLDARASDAPSTAGGMPRPMGVGLLTALIFLFVLMLGGPAGGLPVAVTVAYLTLYTLGYFILRSSRPRAAGFARDRSAQLRILAVRGAAASGRAVVAAGRAAAAEVPRMIAEVRRNVGHPRNDTPEVGRLRQPIRS